MAAVPPVETISMPLTFKPWANLRIFFLSKTETRHVLIFKVHTVVPVMTGTLVMVTHAIAIPAIQISEAFARKSTVVSTKL